MRARYIVTVVFLIGLVAATSVGSKAQSPGDIFGAFGQFMQEAQRVEGERRQQVMAVQRLQAALQRLGYYGGDIDGSFGPGTQAAVTAYFGAKGIPLPASLSFSDLAAIEADAASASSMAAQEHEPAIYDPLSPAPYASLSPVKSGEISLKQSGDDVWIVVASAESIEEARQVAIRYAHDFWSTSLVRSANGRYAVLVGWVPKEMARSVRDALQGENIFPSDVFFGTGESFRGPIWTIDASQTKTRSDFMRYTLFRPSPSMLARLSEVSGQTAVGDFRAQVVKLSDPRTGYLALRQAPSPSGKELRRLPAGSPLKLLREKDGWFEVALLNGAKGWVSGNYIAEDTTTIAESAVDDGNDGVRGSSVNPTKEIVDQEVLDAKIGKGKDFLEDADGFLKVHPEIDDVASIAEQISQLKLSIDKASVAGIDAALTKLETLFAKIDEFREYRGRRAQERLAAELKALGTAVAEARRNQFFLKQFIARNVTSPSAAKLATLLKEYQTAMTDPTLAELSRLQSSFNALIASEGLRSQFDEVVASYAAPEAPKAPGLETGKPENLGSEQAAGADLPNTVRARLVTEGDLSDFLVLFNNGGSAPSVVRNLRGDIVFDKPSAKACLFEDGFSDAAPLLNALLKDYGGPDLVLSKGSCPEGALQSFDIYAGRRGQILQQPKSYLLPVLGLLEEGKVESLEILTAARQSQILDAPSAAASSLENEIEKGLKVGFGIVQIGNQSSNVCVTVVEQPEGTRLAFDSRAADLKEAFGGNPSVTQTTLDGAFKAARRGECGGIYATALDLKSLVEGFRREKVAFRVVPVWFDASEIARLEAEAEKKKVEAAADDAKRKQEIEDAARLEEKRRADQAASREARESGLREANGALARAREGLLREGVTMFVDGRDGWIGEVFPDFAAWYAQRRADGWEFVSLETQVDDFGTAVWKDRSIEAAMVDARLRMKNGLLGEDKTFCFVLGGAFDDEFDRIRTPFVSECGGSGKDLVEWRRAGNFQSRWRAD